MPPSKLRKITIGDAEGFSVEGLTELHNLTTMQAIWLRSVKPGLLTRVKKIWEVKAFEAKKRWFAKLNCIHWPDPQDKRISKRKTTTSANPEGIWECAMNTLNSKYEELNWRWLHMSRRVYWAIVDHIVPKEVPYRLHIDREYGKQDWKKLDVEGRRISNYSKQIAFAFRSMNGLLYANKEFYKFQVKGSAECQLCDEPIQTVDHLYLDCRKVKDLFANFKIEYKVDHLTELEKLMGHDTNSQLSQLNRKRLNILRKFIYNQNHLHETPRWASFRDYIGKAYVYEYSIAAKKGKLALHFQTWDM
jgi:hypothetical protein